MTTFYNDTYIDKLHHFHILENSYIRLFSHNLAQLKMAPFGLYEDIQWRLIHSSEFMEIQDVELARPDLSLKGNRSKIKQLV